jgi:hypothetical protein
MTGPCAAPCTVVEWRADRGTEAKRRSRRGVSRRPASSPRPPSACTTPASLTPAPRRRASPSPGGRGESRCSPFHPRGKGAARMRGRDEGEGHAPSCPQPPRVHPVHCVHPPRTNPVAPRTRQSASLQNPAFACFVVFVAISPLKTRPASAWVLRGARRRCRPAPPHSMTGRCARPSTSVEWRADRGTEAKRRSRRVVSRRPARFLKAG